MLNISKISERFCCEFGMVSPKYTIHRSNIKTMPCWAEIFALYGNTQCSLICTYEAKVHVTGNVYRHNPYTHYIGKNTFDFTALVAEHT